MMRAAGGALLACMLVAFAAYPIIAQSDAWKPFKMGLVEESFTSSQTQVDEIRFERLGSGNLGASLNVKNLADEDRAIQISIALFNEARELLCANITASYPSGPFDPRPETLRSREAKTLRLSFGVCGWVHSLAGRIKSYQVGVYAQKIRR